MRAFGWIFIGAMLVASALTKYPQIEAFTTARTPIATVSIPAVQVYTLDAPAMIEAELSATLPVTVDSAESTARQAVQPYWRAQAQQLTQAYQGLLKARQYELQKLPAIVFDGQAVVYGVTDLEQALRDYRRWQAGSP
jgi:integrating conjugative element protein (TIGR03757 family)